MADTTSLKLPDDLKEKVSALAHGVAQSPHAYMVEAIAQRVERDERRQQFLQAGLESAASFRRTGVAYAHEDVKRFLLKRAAGKKARKPKSTRVPPSER